MEGTRTRTFLAITSSFTLAALAAGCGSGAPSQERASASATGRAVVGSVHLEVADVDLTIRDAVAHLDRSGDGCLSMTIRNDDGVPEHLAMVATPGGGRADLAGAESAEGSGSLSTAGILLEDGTTVAFRSPKGGSGPRVLLRHVRGVTAGRTLPLTLQFGVAGLVRLQARVTS